MRVRVVATVLCAGAALSACGISSSIPQPAGTGTVAFVPTVTMSVVACEPVHWCIAAGTNPTASVGTSGIEVSPGGRGGWGRVAAPPLVGVTLSAAGCWASGCLLGGQGPSGSVDVIVNPRHRDASFSGSLPGEGVSAITCTRPGRCLALVTTTTETLAFETTTSGSSWLPLAALPATITVASALTCSTPRACVAVGAGPHGAEAVYTRDGGASWKVAVRPGGLQVLTSAACGSVTWCLATARSADGTSELLQSNDGGARWLRAGTRVSAPDAVACATTSACLVGGSGPMGGALSIRGPSGQEHVLALVYVPEAIVELACASSSRCAGITQASMVSVVP